MAISQSLSFYGSSSSSSQKWVNGSTITLVNSLNEEIPARSTITSIDLEFQVLVNNYHSSYKAVLTSCSITGNNSISLFSKSGSASNPLASHTDIDPTIPYFCEINEKVTTAISSLTIASHGQAPNLSSSYPAYLTHINATVYYTLDYASGGSTPGRTGYLSNYPLLGEFSNGTGSNLASLAINGNDVSSGSFSFNTPSECNAPYYLVYSSSNSGSGSFTQIGTYSSSNGSFIPSQCNIAANTKYFYSVLAYSEQHNGYVQITSPTSHTFVNVNTNPVITSVVFSPKFALAAGSEVSIAVNATDSEQTQLSYQIIGQNVSQTFSSSTFTTTLYPGTYTIKVSDNAGGDATSTITLQEIEQFNIDAETQSLITNIDTSSIEQGLVKIIDKLKPIGCLGSSIIQNLTFSVEYSYGTSATSLTSGSGTLGTGAVFENIDIGELESDIAADGLWYQFNISSSYTQNGIVQNAVATFGPFKYPKPLQSPTYTLYNGGFVTNFSEDIPRNLFNDVAYLKITYPTNGTSVYSKVKEVKIYIVESETETFKGNYSLVKTFSSTNLTSDNIEVDIKDIVPYCHYFNTKVELITLTGEKKEFLIEKLNNATLQRTYLPYFSGDIITINLPETIAIKNLEAGTNLELTVPTVYSINDPEGTTVALLKSLLENVIFKLTIDNNAVEAAIPLADVDGFWYVSDSDSFKISLSPDTLIEMLTAAGIDTSENAFYQAEISFIAKDLFENQVEKTFLVNTTNTRNSDNIVFSLGVKPAMGSSTESYSLKVKIPYSSTIQYAPTTTENSYKNIINPADTLYFSFPPATDENGNDTGAAGNHGDILGYKIKVQEKDNKTFTSNEEDFSTLLTIPVTDSNLSYQDGIYTYSYTVPNRNWSKFAKVAVCAYDSTSLESSIHIYEPILVLSRVTTATGSIINYKKNKTQDTTLSYNLTLKIADIGGTLFETGSTEYFDYPNLERNVSGTIGDSRNIIFSLYYKKEGENSFNLYDGTLSFNINGGTVQPSYNSATAYDDMVGVNINFPNLIFTSSELDAESKINFKFEIKVQTGFNASGEKVYSTVETPVYTIFPKTPVMYFGKNAVGINAQELDDNKVLRIATVEQEKNLFQIDSFDEQSSVIFDLVSKLIKGITISDEDN